jgi:hypothetical protein
MNYDFLIETYETERIKVVSVWSEFKDEDLLVRPRQGDPRGRSLHEHMVPSATPRAPLRRPRRADALYSMCPDQTGHR